MNRILIIKLRYVGDVVLSTPVLPLIRKSFPEATLTVVVNYGTESVLQDYPFVDEVLTVPTGHWRRQWAFHRKLRHERFDAVVDLTDSDRSALMALMTGAKVRIGFNRERRWRGWCYTHLVTAKYGSMHMVEYHAQVLPFLNIEDQVQPPELFVPPDAKVYARKLLSTYGLLEHPLVLLHPSARYVFKAWPLERFAALADWLSLQDVHVAIIGSQREQLIGQQIINLTKTKPSNLMGQTRVMDLVALMKESLLLIGNDGGPLHMATAVGCPVVGLYGPSDPAVWGPQGESVRVLYKGLDCRECFYPGCFRGEESCMKQITLPEVCDAIRSLVPLFRRSEKSDNGQGKGGRGT